MLVEKRQEEILKIVNNKGSITVTELTKLLNSSESTVRRDLAYLNEIGRLNKVHGGATAIKEVYATQEDDVDFKSEQNIEEKNKIAKFAAEMIKENDFVYIDAGTTTEAMIQFIKTKNTVFVTNGITIAKNLSKMGFKVYIISGYVRANTEAVIGSDAIKCIEQYNFTKGFFGTNGINNKMGYTTPDIEEAKIKAEAMKHCKEKFVLADPSKFSKIFAVKFENIAASKIITTKLADENIRPLTTVLEVDLL